MGDFYFWIKIMATGNLLMTWLNKSMADGKITLTEAAELVDGLGQIWGFSVDLPIPTPDESGLHSELEEGKRPDGTG